MDGGIILIAISHIMDRCLIASIAIRIMSDTRDEEQEQRWRERQDRGVLLSKSRHFTLTRYKQDKTQ
jgi:hypothetical protein